MIPGLYFYQINLCGLNFYTWGVFVSLGFVVALFVLLREARGKGLEKEIIWNVAILALLGMIFGASLRNIFFYNVSQNVFTFSLIEGTVFSGALVFLYLKFKKQNWRVFFDLFSVAAVCSLLITRIGCLLISDHVGKITYFPWGMLYEDGTTRHPIALYHILFLFLIFLVLTFLKRKKLPDGLLFFIFCLLYSVFRFVADFYRCDDLPVCDVHIYGLTEAQWILIPVFFLSILGMLKDRLFNYCYCGRIVEK